MNNDLGKRMVAAIEASQKAAADRQKAAAERRLELAKIKNPKIRAMVAEYIQNVLIEHRDGESQKSIAAKYESSAATLRRNLPEKYRDKRKSRK